MQSVAKGYAAYKAVDKATGGALSRGIKRGAKKFAEAAYDDLTTRKRIRRKKSSNTSSKKLKATVSMSNGSGQKMRMTKKSGRRRKSLPLASRVAKLEKSTKQNYVSQTYKVSATFQVTSIQNRCGYGEGSLINAAAIENLISNIPYVNTAAVGTVSQYNATSLTVPTSWKIALYSKCVMRNNYLYPCNLRCYILKPKQDTSTSATNSITNGISEQANPSVYSTLDPWLFPDDSKEFSDNWAILQSCEMKLQSGDECEFPWSENITYDQEFTDDHTSTYLKKYTRIILIRSVGVVAHDSTTTTNIGIAPTALDCVVYRRYQVKAPSLAPMNTYYVATGLSSMAVAPVVGVASAEVETAL